MRQDRQRDGRTPCRRTARRARRACRCGTGAARGAVCGDRRGAQRRGGAGIAPRVVGLVGARARRFSAVQRAGVGGVALQRVAAARTGRPKASASTGSGGWSCGVNSPLGFAVAVLGHEGAVDAVGPAERLTRCRVDGRTRDGARRQALAPRTGPGWSPVRSSRHPLLERSATARRGITGSSCTLAIHPTGACGGRAVVPSAKLRLGSRSASGGLPVGERGDAESATTCPAASWGCDRVRVPQRRAGLALGVDLGRALGAQRQVVRGAQMCVHPQLAVDESRDGLGGQVLGGAELPRRADRRVALRGELSGQPGERAAEHMSPGRPSPSSSRSIASHRRC